MAITRLWSTNLGCWRYSCGCLQFQDGYELCPAHKPYGYIRLLQECTDGVKEAMTIDNYLKMRDNPMRTMTRRFYPSAQISNDAPVLGILSEAIEKAKQKLIKHPELEEVNIVEIVKVVRRKPVDIDIIVEDVR